MLKSTTVMSFLDGLNPRQREAVEHAEGPLLVLAGAGSGKTRVITHRIAHLMTAHRVPGWAILAVTFTNKAAGEMRDRVRSLVTGPIAQAALGRVPEASELPTVATFHSFCVRLLRREGAPLAQIRPGFTTLFSIYDDDDQLAILKSVYKTLGLDDKFMQHRAALSRISHAKSHKTSPEEMARAATDPNSTRLAAVYERYETRLRESNALDFDDLLLQAVNLLRHDAPTRERLNRRYEFVMVDEYQDTNRTQYDLMRLLTGENGNVAVVGDEDQSIYSWRGANIRNILDFECDFPGAKIIRLEQNYRSTKNILEAASAVVAQNTERIGKTLWTDSGAGAKIALYEAPDAENEALWIADSIETMFARDPKTHVAVLYRTNSQSRQIEEALRRYGRKYIVVGGFSFYQRAEVRDLLAYLKILVSPHDSIGLLRIVNTPARGIGRTTMEQAEHYALQHELSLWSAIERMLEEHAFSARAEAALAAFHRMMKELASQVEMRPLSETLTDLLERTGYRKMLEEEGTEDARTRMGNLDELINAAADASERGESIRDFLDHAALVADADSLDERAPVSLLTMHNAKGLEFPVVFIAGLEEGLFPHSRSLDSESAMEEERRLCYVGMTRAEQKLHLSWARYRRRFGGGAPEQSIASRFLREVPPELVDALRAEPPRGYGVDLTAESWAVRESARKNLYTGKTYNSVDSIRQFFDVKPQPGTSGAPAVRSSTPSQGALPMGAPPGIPQVGGIPQAVNRPAASGINTGVSPTGAGPVKSPVPSGIKKARKFGPGSTVEHAKYGRGTVLRLEGTGEDTKITVSFPGYGLKKLIAKYAGIKVE